MVATFPLDKPCDRPSRVFHDPHKTSGSIHEDSNMNDPSENNVK